MKHHPPATAPRRGRRTRRWLLGLLLGLLLTLLLGLPALALLVLRVNPLQAWQALHEHTPMELVRYAEGRLRGHNKLEALAGPLLDWVRSSQLREVPAELPTLGKGQQAQGLTPQRHDPAGRPLPAMALSAPMRASWARFTPASVAELEAALQQARAGDVIELQPGEYLIRRKLRTGQAGQADAPILLRARQPGTVTLVSTIIEILKVQHPYWVIENLDWQGRCSEHEYCGDHAVHVVGAAQGTVIRNNRMTDFNAHIKVNGEAGQWPDHGLVQFNTLNNTAPRRVIKNSITPFDLVGAHGWQVLDNRVSDFIRPDTRKPSYGIFMKGGSVGGRIERNLVICTTRDIAQPGLRVGISLGGGGTDPGLVRSPGEFRFEHREGLVQANVVAHCNDFGIDLNRAQGSQVRGNVLINTAGIDLRQGSQASLSANTLDGRIRARDGSLAQTSDNRVGALGRWLAAADRLDLSPVAP